MSAHAEIHVSVGGQDPGGLGVRIGTVTLAEALWDHASFTVECLALDEGTPAAISGSHAKLDALFQQIGAEFQLEVLSPDRATVRHTLRFTGVVTDARAERQRGGGYRVVLQGHGKTYLLDLEANNSIVLRDPQEMDLAESLKGYLDPFDFCSVDVPSGTTIPAGLIRYHETVFGVVEHLAQRFLLWTWYDGAKYKVASQLPEDAVELTMGTTVFENSLDTFELSARIAPTMARVAVLDEEHRERYFKQSGEIALSGTLHKWAQQSKEAYEKLSKDTAALYAESRMRSLAELTAFLENRKKAWASHLVEARGTSSNADVRVAKKLKVTGLQEPQAGQYVFSRVWHTMDAAHGTYANEFEVFPFDSAAPRWVHRRPQALEVLPGKVVEDKDAAADGAYVNSRMGQVKVSVTGLGKKLPLWASVAMPYAGADGGFFTMPEVGDEVLVAFLEGDPTRPVVIGSLYTKNESKVFGKLKEVDKNLGKGLLTKGGNKILIQDEQGKETIVISTPDEKNYLKLSMDGGAHVHLHTAGHMSLSCGSMSIDVGKDMKVTVGGDMVTQVKGDMAFSSEADGDFDADGDITVSGKEVEVTGDDKIELSVGGSSITLDSGQIEEKSSMIKLN